MFVCLFCFACKGGGGGFFLAFEDLGRMYDIRDLHFLKAEISSRTVIPFFMPGSVHSGSAS